MALSVLQQAVCFDTVELLKNLLAAAEQGEVVGLAVAAMHQKGHYTVDTSGVICENPTFGIGASMVLVNSLMTKV